MTDTSNWLKRSVPGFAQLSDDELSAIVDFSLLWGLFESRVLDTSASAARICSVAKSWRAADLLDASICEVEISFFRKRYFENGAFTYHFDHLHLRNNDREPLVRSVLDGSDSDPANCLATALIIVFRYRNNLFHGVKWQYQLAGQLENLTHANALLMKALERSGRLADI